METVSFCTTDLRQIFGKIITSYMYEKDSVRIRIKISYTEKVI